MRDLLGSKMSPLRWTVASCSAHPDHWITGKGRQGESVRARKNKLFCSSRRAPRKSRTRVQRENRGTTSRFGQKVVDSRPKNWGGETTKISRSAASRWEFRELEKPNSAGVRGTKIKTAWEPMGGGVRCLSSDDNRDL